MDIRDAQTLVVLLSSVIIPFAVSWIKQVTWPAGYKFGLAAVLSFFAGLLSVIAAGQFDVNASIIQNGAIILTAAQSIYYVAFKGLGLEKVIYPKAALVSEVKQDAAEQVDKLRPDTVDAILDKDKAASVDVDVKAVNLPQVPNV